MEAMSESSQVITLYNMIRSEIKSDIRDLNTRIDKLEARFDNLEAKFDNLEARFDNLEARLDNFERRFEDFQTAILGYLENMANGNHPRAS